MTASAKQWKPIQSAPQDGTKIVVTDGRRIWFDKQRIGKYAARSRDGMPIDGYLFSPPHDAGYPTHWTEMPNWLVKPPELDAEGPL